ncbi:glycosyltransferase family 4 protein [Crocosphaera sp. XPORK-15E]|uniref:glycosyltransferase family 4 protein n=1 Tax=Crocosphaera sp. XPORK-15E TaxID=3110247 RepID=UPI002B1F6342|nr:glycosyltransferase family 4 protein [Crocosphaera sp. XPORK-15E]MEA5534962.1 glycosyltransferase family 4 protein [Crocosphaera sp. XPORK-15E]
MVTKISVLAPALSGGGGTRAYLLAQVLQKLDYDVTVFGVLFGESFYPVPPSNIKVISVKGNIYPQFFASITELIKQIDGDLLYAIKPRPTSFGIALFKRLLNLNRCPIILDIDDWEMSWFGGDGWRYKTTPKHFLKQILKKDGDLRNPDFPLYLQWMEKLINQADAITVDTQFLQNRYGGIYLPNGKDTTIFDPEKFDYQESRQKYHLSEYRVLMFPGTARPHKGLEDVLMAMDQLNQPDLRLVVVGGREIKDGYIEMLIEKWPQWLIKLPQQPLQKMPELLAGADIIVVPQRNNPTANAQFPIKLTDGMAMAKPIISTRIGDIPKILGDTGYLIEPNSPAQIATQIEWIFANLEEAKMKGLQARKLCLESYSIDAMAKIVAQVINGVS